MRYKLNVLTALAVLMVTASLVGCGDSPTPPPPPGIQPEIINIADSFEYQVQSLEGYSGAATYVWQNSGTSAAVDHSSVIGAGGGTVVVRDAGGAEVYSGPLSTSGSLVSSTGASGNWTITVSYSSFSGTVNFRVQKA